MDGATPPSKQYPPSYGVPGNPGYNKRWYFMVGLSLSSLYLGSSLVHWVYKPNMTIQLPPLNDDKTAPPPAVPPKAP